MADLRGQKLKDSYQNVVTRGTGNKLEDGNGVEFADLDDKASLPVIDSNENGTFIKWYVTDNKGWMRCISPKFTLIPSDDAVGSLFRTGSSDRVTWEFPSVFSETPQVSTETPDLNFATGISISITKTSAEIGYLSALSRSGTSVNDNIRSTAEGPFDDTPE